MAQKKNSILKIIIQRLICYLSSLIFNIGRFIGYMHIFFIYSDCLIMFGFSF